MPVRDPSLSWSSGQLQHQGPEDGWSGAQVVLHRDRLTTAAGTEWSTRSLPSWQTSAATMEVRASTPFMA
jgi:hypothetical protein